MGNYFKSLRRKIGVVTLLIACVGMGVLVRGLFIADFFAYHISNDEETNITSEFHLTSNGSSLKGEVISFVGGGSVFPGEWRWNQRQRQETLPIEFHLLRTRKSDINWYWHFCGIHVAAGNGSGSIKYPDFVVLILPLWFIIAPLTLLSAYLLLSKPRKAKSLPCVDMRPTCRAD